MIMYDSEVTITLDNNFKYNYKFNYNTDFYITLNNKKIYINKDVIYKKQSDYSFIPLKKTLSDIINLPLRIIFSNIIIKQYHYCYCFRYEKKWLKLIDKNKNIYMILIYYLIINKNDHLLILKL